MLKDQVLARLRSGDEEGVAALVAAERRAVRFLVPRLWDPDQGIRARAARALGEAAARHEDLGRETVRRLLWGLNDESATNGAAGLPALGEIGRRSPALIAPYLPAMAALVADEGLRVPVVEALAAVAASAPGLVAPLWPAVARQAQGWDGNGRAALERLRAALEGRTV